MIDYHSFTIFAVVFSLIVCILWILPGVLLWNLRGERNIYLVNVVASILFLFFMYRLIPVKPHAFLVDFTVLNDFGELVISWLLWGIFLLLYSLFRRLFKWRR